MSTQPFLSVVTPTHRRPTLLARCRASVDAQTLPCEHVVIPDDAGIGIDGVYAAMPTHAHEASGCYVMVLSDDNILIAPTFAQELRREAERADWPDAIVFRESG